jgi:hypothetical protein
MVARLSESCNHDPETRATGDCVRPTAEHGEDIGTPRGNLWKSVPMATALSISEARRCAQGICLINFVD